MMKMSLEKYTGKCSQVTEGLVSIKSGLKKGEE
jgi:hypothetical protein